MKHFRAHILLMVAILLSGCASTFSSRVNTVNQLPEVINSKTYALLALAEQAAEPEYVHASEDLKTRLHELGFEEVEVSRAALKISLQLVTIPGDTHVSSPFGSANYLITPAGLVIPMGFPHYRNTPSFFRTPSRFYPSTMFSSRFYGSYYSPFVYNRRFGPFFAPELNVRQYFDHGIEIAITETSSGKALYTVSAKTTQNDTEIAPYIGLLVESALREFPQKSGEHTMTFQLEK